MTSWIVPEDVLGQAPLIRDARREDVGAIVELYRSDERSQKHDNLPGAPVPAGYYTVFDAIERDARNRLLVAELGGTVPFIGRESNWESTRSPFNLYASNALHRIAISCLRITRGQASNIEANLELPNTFTFPSTAFLVCHHEILSGLL